MFLLLSLLFTSSQRKLAIEYGMLRNRFFRKAADFYQKGDGTKAKLYSMEAHKYNHLMREMHTEASQRIFEQRSKNEAFIDLHGLHQDEALDIIDERLSRMRGHYEGVIYIVTGTGHHSGTAGLTKKQSKLKPCVENYLKQEYYRFAETSIVGDSKGGVFAVDLSS
jgi:DNA-nicking Smr family endonuclease